jgi:ABC-type uncharacterized transport system permease subunit
MDLEGLLTAGGVATVLSVLILPLAKRLGAAGKWVLVIGLIAGVMLAEAAALILHGVSAHGAGDALLTGLGGALIATGAYETKKTIAK